MTTGIEVRQRSKRRFAWIIGCLLLIVSVVGVGRAPFYLAHQTSIEPSDTVIVLIGPGDDAKLKSALWVMESSYAHHLLVPGMVFSCDQLKADCIDITRQRFALASRATESRMASSFENLPWYYLHTHHELVLARRMMEAMGLTSAIVISHPYHMRRISLIVDTVFGNSSLRVHFWPAQTDASPDAFWWLSAYHWQWTLSEYLKIAWFRLYDYAVSLNLIKSHGDA
jgi:hypothetical protein